jgi:uncharacterized protein (TIGR03083 family)
MFEAGIRSLRDWLATLPDQAWAAPSVLLTWTVGDLAAHVSLVAGSPASLRRAARGTAALSPGAYMSRYAAAAAEISSQTRAAAGGPERTPATALTTIDEQLAAALVVLDALVAGDPVVAAGRGPIRLGDYLATRAVEIAVHADDLARSVPGVDPPQIPVDAERLAVRTLLEALAERAPGRSVEVRIPPYAAVQCIEGPRHSRGTPANVVETDPVTWLRLAAGRVTWDDAIAAARVLASGDRADLKPYLPVC